MPETQKRLLSIEETATYMSISAKTIRNRLGPRATDPFPITAKRFGKRVLFDIRDIDKYIDGMPTT